MRIRLVKIVARSATASTTVPTVQITRLASSVACVVTRDIWLAIALIDREVLAGETTAGLEVEPMAVMPLTVKWRYVTPTHLYFVSMEYLY
jgi:hypothetical protein